MVKNLPAKVGDPDSIPGFGSSPGEGIFLPGKTHGHRGLAGYNLQGHKELDMT